MATQNTDTYADQINVVRYRAEGQRVTGELKQFFAIYTTTATEVAADVLNIVQLPVGAIILPDTIRITSEGIGGTGVTFSKIGDAGDDDRYTTSAVALTAAGTALAVTPTNAIALTPYSLTKDTNVLQATWAGTLPVTANKKIAIRGWYRMP